MSSLKKRTMRMITTSEIYDFIIDKNHDFYILIIETPERKPPDANWYPEAVF